MKRETVNHIRYVLEEWLPSDPARSCRSNVSIASRSTRTSTSFPIPTASCSHILPLAPSYALQTIGRDLLYVENRIA